jgi:hypothetical protein
VPLQPFGGSTPKAFASRRFNIFFTFPRNPRFNDFPNFPRKALPILAQYISEPPEMTSQSEKSKKAKTTKGN